MTSRTLPDKPREGGKIRICCAGFPTSQNAGRARKIIDKIADVHGDKYETWYYWAPGRFHYEFVEYIKAELTPEQAERFSSRDGWSSPFVWLELPEDGSRNALGGRDDLCDWVFETFQGDEDKGIIQLALRKASILDRRFSKEPGTAEGQDPAFVSQV